jgi:pimeloyl-ACP methyl ester carboxylesterase
MPGRTRQTLGLLAIAAAVAASGCKALNPHPIPLSADCCAACGDVPCPCRGKVYVFLLRGFDPLDLDRVDDVRTALNAAGFTKVYDGQFYHERFFAEEMRRLSRAEPDARFVVVGFSLGAQAATGLAESVGKEGIPVAMLASVDPYWWSSAPRRKPANVEQVMHVHGERLLFAPTLSAGADVQIPGSWPSNVTANPLAVETVARALANVAGTLPKPSETPATDYASDLPTPRPVARREGARDAWDFLKPLATLPSPHVSGEERTSLRPAQPVLVD